MLSNCIPKLILFPAMSLLLSCATLDDSLSPAESTREIPASSTNTVPNAVCNHQFNNTQLAAEPRYSENEKNSIISGRTVRELLSSLIGTAPDRGSGKTRWDLKWSFDSRNGSRGCEITSVDTNVSINYELPLWPDQVLATDRDLTDQWSRYSDALRAHHCKHGKTGIDASIEVKESLRRMAPRKTCVQLKADADSLARSIIGNYKAYESQFVRPSITDFFTR